MALAYTARDRMLDRYIRTLEAIAAPKTTTKVVAYLSAEFLTGPHLGNSLISLGIWETAQQALSRVGLTWPTCSTRRRNLGSATEASAGWRHATWTRWRPSTFPPSATASATSSASSIKRFETAGRSSSPTSGCASATPGRSCAPRSRFDVKFGGRTESYIDDHELSGPLASRQVVKGVAYDIPVPGYRVPTTNLLRLWKAEAAESFDFDAFNVGDYYGAVDEKVASETISKVLYPNDEPEAGKQLRLEQQFFFVSCSLQDMIRLHLLREKPLDEFDSYWAAQLNDTHPSIAVAELMRLLVDEHLMDWDQAWAITQRTCGYTNHTLLAEALEKWPLSLFGTLLPRHLEIVYEINRRFLDDVRQRFPGADQLLGRLSLIDESGPQIRPHGASGERGQSRDQRGRGPAHGAPQENRAARLPCRGARQVPQRHERRDTATLDRPEQSETHRVDHQAHRRAMDLGPGERAEGDRTARNRSGFQSDWRAVKADNKRVLAEFIKQRTDITVDPASLFDIQVKRLHEYKRQHLTVLHLVTLYNRLRRTIPAGIPSRTVIFGGKAAPGYRMAKLIIKLINAVGDVINQDPRVSEVLKVVFLPDFNVKNSHRVYPAADLSEQISTAGKEASGTGNMKFAMNGALTIGTLDGANIEIRDAVGPENFFLFGLSAEEVDRLKSTGYAPRSFYESNAELREAIDLIGGGFFSSGDPELFRPLVESLLTRDDYMLLADYQAYVDCQQRVSDAYRDQNTWTQMSILNSARVGRFSSDRSIREYCREIWNVSPITPERR